MDSEKIELSLVLPCYNEAQHFKESAQLIYSTVKGLAITTEIIFVDDKSQDETKKLIEEFVKNAPDKNLHIINHKENQGRGAAVTDGLSIAKGRFAGFMDVDCEVSPKYISVFYYELRKKSDVVCGLRHYEINSKGLVRAFASKFYSFLVKLILGVKYPDTEAGYKFFNRKKIMPILARVKNRGWFWDTEIMILSQRAGLRVKFVPVEFYRRTDKTSTVNLLKDSLNYFYQLIIFRNRLN